MPIPLSALPARYQEQVTAQLHAKPAQPATGTMVRQSKAPRMNKTEQKVYAWLCGVYGEAQVYPQRVTLLLANGVRYTPDFVVMTHADTPILYEAKGRMQDDAAVKLKVCAQQFPRWPLYLVWFQSGDMKVQEILP